MFQLNKLFFLQSTKIYLLYKKSFSRKYQFMHFFNHRRI